MFAKLKNIFTFAGKPAPTILTDDAVKRLVGHAKVVYCNCETNTWNTKKYNGYKTGFQGKKDIPSTVSNFKMAMEAVPEFSQHYEFSAPVSMSIDGALFPGWGKPIANPQYSKTGTAFVGNIIVKNKDTGKYELYCPSWVGVCDYDNPRRAVILGVNMFLDYAAHNSDFCKALIAAHTR